MARLRAQLAAECLTSEGAERLAAELHGQQAASRGSVATCRVDGEWIVFDRADQPEGCDEHRLFWPVSARERVLAHWAGYIDSTTEAVSR